MSDMLVWTVRQRVRYGVARCVGMGLLVGATEVALLAFGVRLPLGVVGMAVTGAVAVLAMGFLGLAIGLAASVLHPVLRDRNPSVVLAAHVAVGGTLLCGWYFWQFGVQIWGQGRWLAALVLLVMPVIVGTVLFFNAAFVFRRLERGASPRVGFVPVAAGVSAAVVAIAAVGVPLRPTGGGFGLADDRSVVVVSIDTLRRDHVGVYGQANAVATPNIDSVAAAGVTFLDAVTPMPETAPAHASVLTGRDPIRHGVLSNGHELAYGFDTLPGLLRDQGYATGAFVSSYALDARTGLSQGFDVYDDGLFGLAPGIAKVNVVRALLGVWMAVGRPAWTPWFLERDGEQTNASLEAWLRQKAGGPFFALVHYFEPHAPYEARGVAGFEDNATATVDHRSRMGPGQEWTDDERRQLRRLYAEEVARADELVGDVLALLDELGVADRTLVVVLSDHGENLGEHGLDYHHHGLFEEVVRVPLVVRAPGLDVSVPKVAQQVRLQDVWAGVLEWCGVVPERRGNSLSILGFAEGRHQRSLWTPLVGRGGRGAGMLIGLRAEADYADGGSSVVKYIRDFESGAEALFVLDDDPGEVDNEVGDNAELRDRVRAMIGPDVAALGERLGEAGARPDPGAAAMLEALGYTSP